MKKLSMLLVVALIAVFAFFAIGSGESNSNKVEDQGTAAVGQNTTIAGEDGATAAPDSNTQVPGMLDNYAVVIDSCRLAKDYEGKDVVIVKYLFTNVSSDTATSFIVAINDQVYQNGIGLNDAFIMDDNANYSSDNQMKEIKKGATLDVEVAYELNDTTTPIEVEVAENFSFKDNVVTKTFTLN